MRVVLDTNILARAIPGSKSPAREVLERLSVAPHVLVLSQPLLTELSRVLGYERMKRVHGLDDAQAAEHVTDVESAAFIVPLVTSVTAVTSDPDDNAVIGTAIDGQTEVICTLDRHFQKPDVQAYCRNHGIQVMTDVELLDLLRKAEAENAGS